ncbi:BON domain-containing protein [Thiohalobacter thiocyanaticus]|uniref:BON domain-containing protein n=1 Tax=Thiohalobacter thiocyanaticus TaxID=585455 RepID=A0A426QLQ8_9GAMM|nr:BON domain-containing protein [Thiohalobacter thiocyanaticus]RRQ22647.1 BON domain-containing protein [Thiohalobacter thiocyanaticus]
MHALKSLFIIIAALGILNGCAPLVVGGTATGVAMVHDRRTAGTVLEDQSIELKALSALRKHEDLYKQSHINVTSYNMMVLMSGETPTEAYKQRAGEIVGNVEKVRRVYNELSVAAPSSMMTRSSDTLITGKVKTSLFRIKGLEGFDPTRVKVVTENGTVYLMGLLTRREGDAVAQEARSVGGVQRVVKLFEYID